jgi:alanine racemase
VRPERWTWADVDLDAVRHNVRLLADVAAPARLLAVVKANAYGHGAVPVAEAALEAGAHALGVALVQEGIELRRAGIEAPILVLSEQPLEQIPDLVAHGLVATVYTIPYIDLIAEAARRVDVTNVEVHLKIDTGMHRVGAQPSAAVELAGRLAARSPQLVVGGVFTHLSSADLPDSDETDRQLDLFDAVLEDLRRAGRSPEMVHVANSAATLAHPRARRDMVRIGISMYGIAPDPALAHLCAGLRPAMSLRSRVSLVKTVKAGDGVSYGLRHRFVAPARVATVPVGYADGVPRRLFGTGGEVLIRGRRRPIVGVVTMDQLMVEVDDDVVEGDVVTLFGVDDHGERVEANEWASRLGTIGYEIVCGVSARVPRRHSR